MMILMDLEVVQEVMIPLGLVDVLEAMILTDLVDVLEAAILTDQEDAQEAMTLTDPVDVLEAAILMAPVVVLGEMIPMAPVVALVEMTPMDLEAAQEAMTPMVQAVALAGMIHSDPAVAGKEVLEATRASVRVASEAIPMAPVDGKECDREEIKMIAMGLVAELQAMIHTVAVVVVVIPTVALAKGIAAIKRVAFPVWYIGLFTIIGLSVNEL